MPPDYAKVYGFYGIIRVPLSLIDNRKVYLVADSDFLKINNHLSSDKEYPEYPM